MKNPLVARYAKFIVAIAGTIVEIANVWADGPEWLYIVAASITPLLVVMVPNAPKYRGQSRTTG